MGNSLPLDYQWLSQAYKSISIFTALWDQYHPRYHAKFIDLQLAIPGICKSMFVTVLAVLLWAITCMVR